MCVLCKDKLKWQTEAVFYPVKRQIIIVFLSVHDEEKRKYLTYIQVNDILIFEN